MMQKEDKIKSPINVQGVFPIPIYSVRRDSNIDVSDSEEVKSIIKEGMHDHLHFNNPEGLNSSSNDSYIFDTKLKNLKEFCEQHIKIYVKEIIVPEGKPEFYITQSWLNVTKPGESLHLHAHSNSIISGVFYISTEEDDSIMFTDPNLKVKEIIKFVPKGYNIWNSTIWSFPAKNNELLLFPSWLSHQVIPNEKATKDRISISFNTFIKGSIGSETILTKLVL